MSSSMWVLIAISVLIIIIGLIAIFGGFKPYQPTPQDLSVYTEEYKINSPWGIPEFNADGTIVYDSSGQIVWSTSGASAPVSGDAGRCAPYTWKAADQFTPGFPSITSIAACVAGGPDCAAAPNWVASICVDDDQLEVQKLEHYCRGDFSQVIRTAGQCMGADGQLHPKLDIEEFWTTCQADTNQSSNRCQGSLSLVTFNSDISHLGPAIFANASCLSVPSYTLTTVGSKITITNESIEINACDMTKSDNHGLPSELIRVVRATYTPKGFVFNSGGLMVKLVHRPSGMFIGPSCQPVNGIGNADIYAPILNGQLRLYKGASNIPGPRRYAVKPGSPDPEGYWWCLLPPLSDPGYTSTTEPTPAVRTAVERFLQVQTPGSFGSTDTRMGSLQYLAYIPDVTVLLKVVSTPKDLWTFVSTSATAPPIMSSYGGTLTMIPFQIINLNSNRSASGGDPSVIKALASSAQYYDYAILPLILKAPVGYYFR